MDWARSRRKRRITWAWWVCTNARRETALHETDLLLVFGARLDDRVTGDPQRALRHMQKLFTLKLIPRNWIACAPAIFP